MNVIFVARIGDQSAAVVLLDWLIQPISTFPLCCCAPRPLTLASRENARAENSASREDMAGGDELATKQQTKEDS